LLINNYIKEIIMRNTFSRMVAIALTLWFGFAAGTANAVTTIPLTVTQNWTAFDGIWTLNFQNAFGMSASTSYEAWLNFSLPVPSTGVGQATSTAVTGFGSGAALSALEIWNYDTSSFVTTSLVSSTANSRTVDFVGQAVPGNYKLLVDVSGANSITGSIATLVPEPETYAMMLAGLGLVGFSARRRNNNT
jgi:PEP-CTERM motif